MDNSVHYSCTSFDVFDTCVEFAIEGNHYDAAFISIHTATSLQLFYVEKA